MAQTRQRQGASLVEVSPKIRSAIIPGASSVPEVRAASRAGVPSGSPSLMLSMQTIR